MAITIGGQQAAPIKQSNGMYLQSDVAGLGGTLNKALSPGQNPFQNQNNPAGASAGSYSNQGSSISSGLGSQLNAPVTSGSSSAPMTDGSNVGTFNTINTPQNIYTPDQTQQALNQSVADSRAQADPRWQEKAFQSGGRSTDAGMMGAAAPQIGQQLAAAQTAMGMIPLQDQIANQNNMLSGQVNQENESLGLAQLLGNMSLNNEGNQLGWLSTLTGPVLQGLL